MGENDAVKDTVCERSPFSGAALEVGDGDCAIVSVDSLGCNDCPGVED